MEIESGGEVDQGRGRIITGSVLVVLLLAWLWPIGLGGKMPVGGDVTQFSIGLMAELSRSIREGRLPLWNDLWGYGFPGLAESQMGVYYPPHLILYGMLPVEWAYTASLVAHTVWAGLGAAWAAQRFGVGRRSAVLAGFAFGTSGFFLVHLPHQWGATTASWMPWAWGLAWTSTRDRASRRGPLGLAATLAVQLLPGHFQLAFITEVTTVVIGIAGLLSGERPGRGLRAARLAAALASVLPLAIAQIGPTAELAALAGSRRDLAYLSAFASPPTHLISYVAPGLFHRSPLWRPLAWDTFHAMPEEHLATVGLVPLLLATIALARARRDAAVVTLAVVAGLATLLSFGPYAPGFASLCRLPGFSFFRAPARWGAAAMLAASLLAGKGLDVWPTLADPSRVVRRFAVVAVAAVLLVVGTIESAFAARGPTVLDRLLRTLPWEGDPSLSARLAAARRPLDDVRVSVALARQGLPSADPADRTLARRRGRIYVQEIGPTAVLLGILVAAVPLARRRPGGLEALLWAVLLAEAAIWSRLRPFDLGPVRPLLAQSPVLRALADLPRGTRSIDPARNLPMVAGAAPIEAYRTLDLPVLPGLGRLAAIPEGGPQVTAALHATGAGVKILIGAVGVAPDGWAVAAEFVADPTLLGWLYGDDWVRSLGASAPSTFALLRPGREPARAWFVSVPVESLEAIGDDPGAVLAALKAARPLAWRSSRPEDVVVEVEATGPGTVVLSQLDYPRWRATLGGDRTPIVPVFGGWQGVAVPGPGRPTLRLVYDGRTDRAYLAASGLAWAAWGLLYWWAGRRAGIVEGGR